ncbi:hypothetical protein E2493_03290 [Sphingomonas parva]|uniref:ABC transporter substrate-binding protein n=1 Tax=Sphingomonas parva TaxID=2555898 RepID=A0A4Y8ZYH8_9SPHN|nr:hypothetical protein [Sphingomonas parva]TFI59656.1 hypothetical protein E2493_03290 [Sphingomonas parva]
MRNGLILGSALFACACSGIPRDPEGTLERVRAERAFKVGVIARGAAVSAAELAFLRNVERATGARAAIETGSAENLLLRLEEGGLDLVVGPFGTRTPWITRVSFVPPPDKRKAGEGVLLPSAAARNGENGWIALLHGEADALGGGQ